MNPGYDLHVLTLPAGQILSEIDYVEQDGIRTTILRQMLDTSEVKVKDALIELGWTPPKSAAANIRCIVKGCSNIQGFGRFVGDICAPCHHMLTTGNAAYNTTFVGDLYQQSKQLNTLKFEIRKLFKEQ